MSSGERDVPSVTYEPIGTIVTPYTDWAPHQPPEREAKEGTFKLVLRPELAPGLDQLRRFSHIYVLFHLDRAERPESLRVSPPWAHGKVEVGLFASRSSRRPNPIGLSVVRVLRVEGNEVFTSPLDAYDGTPLLDIKPYVGELDARGDANSGWVDDLEDRDHLVQHLRGVPH